MNSMIAFPRSILPHLGFTALALFGSLSCGAWRQPEPATPAGNDAAAVAHNLLGAYDFSDGVMLPWMTSFTKPGEGSAAVKDQALCLVVDKPGANRWDAQIRHRGITIRQGHEYHVGFTIWSSRPTSVTSKVAMSGPPYHQYWSRRLKISETPTRQRFDFTMNKPDDPTAEFAFHAGGDNVEGTGPVTVCIDDVVLSDPAFAPPPKVAPAPLPKVRLNQIGFLPESPKRAVVLSDSSQPIPWRLVAGSGAVVEQGVTVPHGPDSASGDSVHIVDFSQAKQPGQRYILEVGGEKSDPFPIAAKLYDRVTIDALRFFYHNRSGIPIEMPYAGEKQWTRPAGHRPDQAGCAPKTGCEYTLDVTGGWYDAGDHGKYVVNGGLSVWLLLNAFERTLHLTRPSPLFGDAALNIPESGNGIPDLLDEVRWEIEFLLKMQIPEGKPLAGMAHHKIHDDTWTALGTAPHEDEQPRILRPPSTAATLNLAAAAAQAARVYRPFDAEFSARCLAAAERAWTAAQQHPDRLAPLSDTEGGGAYGDDMVDDEFYWAAAELFATTGAKPYLDAIERSKLDSRIQTVKQGRGVSGCLITWDRVDVLGKMTLALVPSELDPQRVVDYRRQLSEAAAALELTIAEEGYRIPMTPRQGKIPWGSNAWVLGNMVLLGAAADFDDSEEYVAGVVDGMDYLFGRNAMGQSYVTGYGLRPLEHPHHRFWAQQADANYPPPPPGMVSGGPNSDLQDPYVLAAGLKDCPPHKCFVDHIEAYSVNEVAINWNAALVWAAAWLAERDAGRAR